MALGWYAPGDAPMVVRFTPPLSGYLWTFPRRDHVGVGICAPLGEVPTRVPRRAPRARGGADDAGPARPRGRALRPHHPVPLGRPARHPGGGGRRLRARGGRRGLADPITGEGIFYALRSAALLAETLLAEGSPARYPERVLEDFGRDLLKAAALQRRFYAPGFAGRMVRYAARSRAIRDVLGDLVLGRQGYAGPEATPAAGAAALPRRGRLVRAMPRLPFDPPAQRRAARRGVRSRRGAERGRRTRR